MDEIEKLKEIIQKKDIEIQKLKAQRNHFLDICTELEVSLAVNNTAGIGSKNSNPD